jgi:hypothetical protein
MIRAEKAQRIMQLYESDYDNFLDKLQKKRKPIKPTKMFRKLKHTRKNILGKKQKTSLIKPEELKALPVPSKTCWGISRIILLRIMTSIWAVRVKILNLKRKSSGFHLWLCMQAVRYCF